jgi:snapalysin
MSGSSAPVSCTNANPSTQERAGVEANFRTSVALPARTYVWQPGPMAALTR